MKKVFLVAFCAISLLCSVSGADILFVSPSQTCTGSCTGTQANPFNNLLDAIQQASSSSSATILLLYSSSASHYLLDQAYTNGGSGAPSPSDPTALAEFAIENLIIKPLLCTEEPAKSDSSLSTLCIEPNSKLTIFLKTTKFKLTVTGSLTIQNIQFDAIEDIRTWNTAGDTDLEDCLSNHKRCCDSSHSPSTLYPDTLICDWHNDYSTLSLDVVNSLFVFSDGMTTAGEIQFTDCEFKNFLSPERASLVQTGPQPFKLTFNGVILDRVYFDGGVISYSDASGIVGSSGGTNSSLVIIQNTVLKNYNDWNMLYQTSTRREGYLFNAQDTFSGSLQISESVFQDSISSLRNTCWDQTTDYYEAPMNNLLQTEPRSRSNLWNQYHQETGANNDSVSSLIYMESLYGAVSILDSSFSNIIGTSGSILRIDDIVSFDTWLTIYNSNFDGTFAYDKFSSIMIAKKSDPVFASMLKCPYLEVFNSTFTNSYGCPGAYGNLLYLCYWDSQPPTSTSSSKLSSYSLGSEATSLTTSWTSESPDYTVRIIQSTFSNNFLAVSNSLALIGTSSTLLQDNIFKDNGGTTAEIAQYTLENSYFLEKYPSALTFPLPLTHFGQSSSILLDHFVQLHSLNNTYQGNFGPWEGSMALASSLTLLNWIKMIDGITSNQDSFKEHQGISSKFLANSLTYQNLIYTEPMISFSLDSDGSSLAAAQISTIPELKNPIQVTYKAFTTSNNIASYDISSFTYNLEELSDVINNIMSISNHYQTGFFKLLWASEVKDDFSLSFHSDTFIVSNVKFTLQDATIENNELLTSGCLFQNSFSLLKNLTITNNQIYLAGETFQESIAVEESYLIAPEDHNSGLFCVGQSDFSGSASLLRFVASSLFVKDNIGILINLFPDSQASGYLSDSVFVNNSCTALSMISVRTSSDFTSLNNIFIANFNSLGNIYIYLANFLNSVSNIHLKNDGKYASLYYMESSYAYECLAKAYWNTLSPTYKVFTDGLIPQSGLYFNSYTFFTAFQSTYEENFGYGGLVVAYGGNTYLQNSEISNHFIVGSSVVGTYLSIANLFINDLFMVNNTIAKDPELPKNRPAVFSLLNANLDANNIFISEGTAGEGATLLFAILTDGQITNMTVNDFYRTDIGQAPLMTLSYSTLDLTNLDFSNTTGVFKLEGGTFSITTSTFQEVTNKYNSQFLIYTSDSILTIQDFTYLGNGEYSTLMSLIEGQKNTITATNLHFKNAAGGQTSTIFDLKSSELFFVSNSIFEYEENSYVTIFALTSSTNVIIQNSVFVSTGSIINANIIEEGFFFLENTIFTESLVQNMVLVSLNSASIFRNHFINPNSENTTPSSFPDSQVQITNSASVIEISQNTFYSLYGTNGIVEFSCTAIPYSANMSQNTFLNNKGTNGGAIYLYAKNQTRYRAVPEIAIDNSVFIQNQALTLDSDEGRGGALHQTTPDMTLQNTWLLGNSFIQNSADGFGGAIYFDYSLPSVDSSCIFTENYAGDLNHIGSYPVRLVLLKQNSESSSQRIVYIPGTEIEDYPNIETSRKWKNIGSGVITDEKFTFALLDMFNQVVYDDNSSLLQIYPEGFTNSQRQTFSNQLSIEASSGLYVLEDFEFTYKVNQKLDVTFKSSAVPSFTRPPIPGLETSSDLTVEISFRNCGIGEFSIQVNGFASCEDCPAGFWQVNPDVTALACEACDDDAMICRGGNQVGPNSGYWRMNKTADVVMQCPIEEACLGNKVTEEPSRILASTTLDPTGSCAETYQGHLCFDCIDGWAKGTSETCVDCRTSSISYVLLFLMIVFKSGIIVFGVREALEFAEKVGKKKHLQIENGILLRAFLNYTQLFSLIVGLPVTWPEVLDKVLSISGKASSFSGQIFTIECFYRLGANAFGIETIYLKAIMNFATPFFFLFFATFFWMIYFTAKKMPILRNKDFTEKIIITVVIICFEQQPEIIKEGFALLRCENLYREDSPIRFLVEAYDIQCWEGLHLSWSLGLVLPTLFIWIILLPGTLFYILTKNRKQLDSGNISKKYSFIYNGYKKEKYYWEAVILIRKIIFISNMVFTPSLNLSIYLSLVFILCSYTLHIATHPYSTHHLNKLERVGLVSLGIVNLCGLYFQIVEGSPALDILVIIAGLIGNLYFFVYFASLFFALQLMKLKKNPKVIKILKIIDKKLCCCRHVPIIKRGLIKAKAAIEVISKYIPTIKLEYIKRKPTLLTFEHQSPKLKKQNSSSYNPVSEDEKTRPVNPDINIELTIAANKYESDDQQQQHIPFESLDSVSLPKFVSSPFNQNHKMSMSEDEGLITLGPSIFSVRSNRKLLTGIDEPLGSGVRSAEGTRREPQQQVGTIKITEIHNSEEHDDEVDFEIPSLMIVSPDGLSEIDPKDFNERYTEDFRSKNN